jgi:hypothetical protein
MQLSAVLPLLWAAAVLAQDPAGQGAAETPGEGEQPLICFSQDTYGYLKLLIWHRCGYLGGYLPFTATAALPVSSALLLLLNLKQPVDSILTSQHALYLNMLLLAPAAAEEPGADNTHWIFVHGVLMSLGWVALLPGECKTAATATAALRPGSSCLQYRKSDNIRYDLAALHPFTNFITAASPCSAMWCYLRM